MHLNLVDFEIHEEVSQKCKNRNSHQSMVKCGKGFVI
jgi:hypothetical protein